MSMKKSLLGLLAAILALALSSPEAYSQKKAMDHDVYDSWQSVQGTMMSPDGNIIVYQVNPQQGDGELFIRNMTPTGKKKKGKEAARELTIPRGYMSAIDPEGKWVCLKIKPEYARTRKEKIDKKKPDQRTKDTLAVVNLVNMSVEKFPNAESFSVPFSNIRAVAYKSSWKEFSDSTDKKGKARSGIIVLDPATSQTDTIIGVDKYSFSKAGEYLAMTTKKDKKDSSSVSAEL